MEDAILEIMEQTYSIDQAGQERCPVPAQNMLRNRNAFEPLSSFVLATINRFQSSSLQT